MSVRNEMPMRWSERQRAMLREMGIHLWLPEATSQEEIVVAPVTPTAAQSAAPPRARTPEPAATTARVPGLAPANWLVVAEPLDAAEPQQQQLLDNILRAIGVALVAPDRERRAAYCPISPRPASAATRASDQARVQAAIATVAPRCILGFGGAAQTLLGDDAPVGGLRGRVHTHGGVPVVVTLALDYLLRHPAEKAKAWADLCLAVGSLATSPA